MSIQLVDSVESFVINDGEVNIYYDEPANTTYERICTNEPNFSTNSGTSNSNVSVTEDLREENLNFETEIPQNESDPQH